MPQFPDFHNISTYPSFTSCPLSTPTSSSPSESTSTLLATIHENMTLSATPTFICKDRDSVSFALKIILPEGMGIEKFEYQRFKKGVTVMVRGARRGGVGGGKQGFIEVGLGDVLIIPASLQKLLSLSSEIRELQGNDGLVACQACGAERTRDELSRCKGCESVWYCNKECQILGWNGKSHKSDCKIIKTVNSLNLETHQ